MKTLQLEFVRQDDASRISSTTLSTLASRLGMTEEDVVHSALVRLATMHGLRPVPHYEADDQEVTDEMYQFIHELVDQTGMRVEKSLFDAFDRK
jgi:hypothetical protein